MRGREEYPARSPTESRGKVEARRRTAGEHGPGAREGKHVQPPPGSADIRRNEGAFLLRRSFPGETALWSQRAVSPRPPSEKAVKGRPIYAAI